MNDNHDTKPIDPVSPDDACPHCGERECDELALDIRFGYAEGVAVPRGRQRRPGCQGLVWLDDERVECQRCKTVYRPGGARDARDDATS